jgi:hypothetical protein
LSCDAYFVLSYSPYLGSRKEIVKREGKISLGKRLVKDIENDITNQAKLELQIFKFHKLAALHIANAIGREFPSEVLVNASNNAVEAKDLP